MKTSHWAAGRWAVLVLTGVAAEGLASEASGEKRPGAAWGPVDARLGPRESVRIEKLINDHPYRYASPAAGLMGALGASLAAASGLRVAEGGSVC